MGAIMNFKIHIIVLFILSQVICSYLVIAENEGGETGAELAILPADKQIPQIIPNRKNVIPLNYTDYYGLNWTMLSGMEDSGLKKVIKVFQTRIYWPLIHPTWIPLLGYTSVVLDVEIIGNPQGWHASVTPTTVPLSTNGTKKELNLEVWVNDLAAENTVTVRIYATRFDKSGNQVGVSYFEIPLRSDNLEYFQVKPIEQFKKVTPDSMAYFQVEITNLGYYVDTFGAKIITDNDTRAIFTEQSVVLNPSETKIVTLQVMTPDVIFDPGTIHTINITGYSIKYPEFVTYSQVQVKTQGFFFHPLLAFSLIVVIIFIFIVYTFFKIMFDKRDRLIYGKPTKPWSVPVEHDYLQELKKKDKVQYSEVLSMMQDEYKSALLWYKSYKEAVNKKKGTKESYFDRLKYPFKKTDSKVEKPFKAGKSTTPKVELSKKSIKTLNDSKVSKTKDQESDRNIFLSPIKQFIKKVLLLTQKKETTEKIESIQLSEGKKGSFKKSISNDQTMSPHKQKLLQEQEEKSKLREIAIKKIEKDQVKQKKHRFKKPLFF